MIRSFSRPVSIRKTFASGYRAEELLIQGLNVDHDRVRTERIGFRIAACYHALITIPDQELRDCFRYQVVPQMNKNLHSPSLLWSIVLKLIGL